LVGARGVVARRQAREGHFQPGAFPLFKRNYKFEKQRKDEAKKKKQEEKRQKKLERAADHADQGPDESQDQPQGPAQP
jgi:hypothetical protein